MFSAELAASVTRCCLRSRGRSCLGRHDTGNKTGYTQRVDSRSRRRCAERAARWLMVRRGWERGPESSRGKSRIDLMEWSALALRAMVHDEIRRNQPCRSPRLRIDIGKTCFHFVGFDARDAIVVRQRCSRPQLIRTLAKLPPCLVGMEACGGARYLGRILRTQGHDVRLIPPQIRSTVHQVEQEGSPGRRSRGRSGPTTDDAVRPREDRRPT